MAFWFVRGLRRGVVTTRYPARAEPSGTTLPTPPEFLVSRLDGELAARLSSACPSRALRIDGADLIYDVGCCTACGICGRIAPDAVVPSGLFELAATDRRQLIKRIKLGVGAVSDVAHDTDLAAERLRLATATLFRRSLHVRTIDTGSCAVCESEIRLLLAPHYDLHRLGLFFTPSPRHADLLLVTGPVVRAMEVALGKTYVAMPEPRVVVAVGACPLGGVYEEDDFVRGHLDSVLPVDVYVPGCPPSPLALLQGLLVAVGRLHEKVSGRSFVADGGSP